MEETKNINTPAVEGGRDKIPYEQLENIAHQLSNQARSLQNKLQEVSMDNAFKRLDYLFKVVESSLLFNQKFVDTCIKEIMDTITLPEVEEDVPSEE